MSNQSNPGQRPAAVPTRSADEVALRDAVSSAAAMLAGVSDALAFRAAGEGDDMLAMLAAVIDEQVARLRAACR